MEREESPTWALGRFKGSALSSLLMRSLASGLMWFHTGASNVMNFSRACLRIR
jgi:hypothetical protein